MSDIKLAIDCQNCVHCKFHKAYESCELRTQNIIIYNHKYQTNFQQDKLVINKKVGDICA